MGDPFMEDRVETSEASTALGRYACYRFLVDCFSFPDEAEREALRRQVVPVLRGVRSGIAPLDTALDAALATWESPVDELRAEHAGVFTHIDSQDCPPHESAFVSDDIFRQTHVMADVAGFARAHGLRVGGRARQRPDHIATELEFMAFMATKEAYALEHLGADEVEECRRTQDHFLRDHLGCWGPAFGRRVELVAPAGLLREAARLLQVWLDTELDVAGIVTAETYDGPAPRQAPEEEGCAFDGAGCDVGSELGEATAVAMPTLRSSPSSDGSR